RRGGRACPGHGDGGGRGTVRLLGRIDSGTAGRHAAARERLRRLSTAVDRVRQPGGHVARKTRVVDAAEGDRPVPPHPRRRPAPVRQHEDPARARSGVPANRIDHPRDGRRPGTMGTPARAARRHERPAPVDFPAMPIATTRAGLPPPLKWAGGKRWQVPMLRRLWAPHAHRRLVEPFCGGLAVALGLGPDRALLNDANPHLINFYQWLQRGLRIGFPMRNDASCYYAYRDRFNALLESGRASSAEAAGLLYYLNRTGYNGLCRFNRLGRYNVPFGRYAAIRYVSDFTPYRDALAGWTFRAGDFADVPLEPDDFVYADPPYDVEFTAYSRGGFT